MQIIQNMCAKLVLKRQKYDSSKQALFQLHWLPIKARIEFKVLTIMYNCSKRQAPDYLTELLCEQVPRRRLRSTDQMPSCYDIPFNKCKTFGDRGFRTIGPVLWNILPLYLKKIRVC